MKKSVKNNGIATTGQYLGVVEEFLPNKKSTFVKNGQIFATKTGLININDNKREININTHQEEKRKTINLGDVVIGTIVFLRRLSVGINFFTINNKLHFNSGFFGNIHVSNISNKYIKEITEAFQITDIIRARITKQNLSEYYLTTTGKDLGVIHADCMICGTTLQKIGYNKLKCPFCGNFEIRKLADDYGNVSTQLIF